MYFGCQSLISESTVWEAEFAHKKCLGLIHVHCSPSMSSLPHISMIITTMNRSIDSFVSSPCLVCKTGGWTVRMHIEQIVFAKQPELRFANADDRYALRVKLVRFRSVFSYWIQFDWVPSEIHHQFHHQGGSEVKLLHRLEKVTRHVSPGRKPLNPS